MLTVKKSSNLIYLTIFSRAYVRFEYETVHVSQIQQWLEIVWWVVPLSSSDHILLHTLVLWFCSQMWTKQHKTQTPRVLDHSTLLQMLDSLKLIFEILVSWLWARVRGSGRSTGGDRCTFYSVGAIVHGCYGEEGAQSKGRAFNTPGDKILLSALTCGGWTHSDSNLETKY